jgi:hypothetical protein
MPWTLLPAAYLLSAFDLVFGWNLVRALPFIVVFAGLVAALLS